MKKSSIIFCLLITAILTYAQDYLTGKMIMRDTAEKKIYYDRTQLAISSAVFQSVYKVMDDQKSLQ